MNEPDDLVLNAMRLAEHAHRTRSAGPHYRKAPAGEDRPAYFIHLAEVGWMLRDAGYGPAVVAAGFLHDLVEDCDYTVAQLSEAIGNSRVADLVAWVSEPSKAYSWEERNSAYAERLTKAPDDVLALSCADKTSNLRDMNTLLARGYQSEAFTSRGHAAQLRKFEVLDKLYKGRVAETLYCRFADALERFRRYGSR